MQILLPLKFSLIIILRLFFSGPVFSDYLKIIVTDILDKFVLLGIVFNNNKLIPQDLTQVPLLLSNSPLLFHPIMVALFSKYVTFMCVYFVCCLYLIASLLWSFYSFFFFFSFIFISWRPTTSQHCSGLGHTLTWISHGVTCIPHPDNLFILI